MKIKGITGQSLPVQGFLDQKFRDPLLTMILADPFMDKFRLNPFKHGVPFLGHSNSAAAAYCQV